MLVRLVDTIALRAESFWLLLGRLMIGSLFVPSGFAKLTAFDGFVAQLASKGVPDPFAIGALAVLVEFGGGLAVVLGFRIRIVALVMIAFVTVAALLSHEYWNVADAAARANQHIHFFKNMAIIGGFLFVFVRGAGQFSLDRR